MEDAFEIELKVSVVIPAYNMGGLLSDAVDSVLTGALHDVEVIVVDDGSTDNTKEIMSRYTHSTSNKYDPRVRYAYQENKGKPSALNHGLRLFRGKYFTILDADDEIPPDSLESRYVKAEEASTPVDCVIGGFSVINEDGNCIGDRKAPETSNPLHLRNQYFFRYKTPFHLCACLLRRELVDRVGFFDRSISRVDDLDYALRVLKDARQIEIVHKSVYCYRKYRSEISERLRYRWATLTQRPRVYWKHATPFKAPVAVSAGLISDLGKGVYEVLIGNYDE